ncbi:CNOT10 family protein [Megaselia abdita]
MTIFSENDFNTLAVAQDQFQQKRFTNCIETLNQLEKSSTGVGKHLKVVHNKAIAKFFENGCKNTDTLLTILEQEDLTLAANSSIQQSSSIAKYNLAIIYFNNKKYEKAIETLSPLIDNLENIYESTAGKVGILFLHLLVITNQIRKADFFLDILLKTLNISLEISKDESIEFSSGNNTGILTTNCDVELRKCLQVIKIHLMILNKEPFNFPEEIPKASQEYEVLKAFNSFLKTDLKSAGQFLINNECGEESELYEISLNNNLGVLQFSNNKIGIAEHFFQCALRYDKELYTNIKSMPSHCLGYLKTPEILYNLGLSKLHLGKSKEAFDCLLVSLRIYHNNPRLWLRVAEACIIHYKSKQETKKCEEHVIHKDKRFSIQHNRRKILYDSSNASSRAIPAPTLEFASFCLSNCLKLLEDYQSKNWEEDEYDDLKHVQHNIFNPSGNLTSEVLNKILACAHLNSSYVALELGDFITAFKHSKELLKLENIPVSYIYIGRMYAGKALVYLNDLVGGQKQFNLENDFIEKLSEVMDKNNISADNAKSIMRYNSFIVDFLLGKHDIMTRLANLRCRIKLDLKL